MEASVVSFIPSDIEAMHRLQTTDIDRGDIDFDLEADIRSFESIKSTLDRENLTDIPTDFRADAINGLVQSSGQISRGRVSPPSVEQILILDTVLFSGGRVDWLGKNVAVIPLLTNYLAERAIDEPLTTREFGRAIVRQIHQDSIEGIPSLFGNGTKHDERRSVTGRLVVSQLAERPFMPPLESDVTDDVERYQNEGVILLGAVDQFVDFGDGQTIARYFANLQKAEKQPVMNRDVVEQNPYTVSVTFQDGSRRTEKLENTDIGSVRLSYQSKRAVDDVGGDLLESEELVGRVIAGYESFKHVPYLPNWLLDSDFANYPCTAELEVTQNGYQITIYGGFKE